MVSHLLGDLPLNVIQMESTQRYSALETRTSAGVQTSSVMKFRGRIDGEHLNAPLKVIERQIAI